MTKNAMQSIIDVRDEQLFWQQNDPSEFSEIIDLSDQFTNLKPSTKVITLRVPEHLLNHLKLIANKRDIPYQSLLKYFLQEKVNEELQTPFLKLRSKVIKKTVVSVAALFIVASMTYTFVVQPIHAQGISMDPSYHADTYYLLDKLVYTTSSPQRGDVVVFSSPSQPKSNFFKRIIGLPGEKVSIQDGNIYISGQKLSEPYASGKTEVRNFPLNNQEIIVPGNSYYLLGDNRDGSIDSRDFGFVTKEAITGKVTTCYWNCQ